MTILQSLDRYYARMTERGEASLPGFSREKIDFAVILSADGRPISVQTLRERAGKRMIRRLMDVPAGEKRTYAIAPRLLWDKTAYSLGRTAGKGHNTAEQHAAFKAANLLLIGGTTDDGLAAFRRFLETWTPDAFDQAPFDPDMLDGHIVFALDGERHYLHEREAAQRLIMSNAGKSRPAPFCLVTGVEAPVARLHRDIKGIHYGQTQGAPLVSFELAASRSYEKQQGDNAPTSELAAFRYVTALNRMLERPSRNCLAYPIADTTVIFWADISDTVSEQRAKSAEDLFASLIDPPTDKRDAKNLKDGLSFVEYGALKSFDLNLAPNILFHILGLSAAVPARPAVRFWLEGTFETFARRLAAHYQALAIEPPPWRDTLPSISRLLVQTTAVQQDFKNISPQLAGEVFRAMLSGSAYPRAWLAAAIIRLRAGDGPTSGWHAAAMKACIARTEEPPPVSLEPENPSTAYQLGRLFAVLEAAQYAAIGRSNSSIADRYYGAASSTPARVFGTLLRTAQTHVSNALKRNQGFWITPRLEQIIGRLPAELPRTLRLEDQGRFAVGYYHERAHRPVKTTPGPGTPPVNPQ